MSTASTTERRIVVGLTTCDAAAHLEQQIDSIARQTRPPDALVVGDDRSTDRTPIILEEFSRRVPFPVHILRHAERLGPLGNTGAVYQRCVEIADVIAIADHDDVWAKDKLAVIEAAFVGEAPPVIWFSDADIIDSDGVDLRRKLFEMVHLDEVDRDMLRAGAGLRRLVHGETVTNPTMAVRADLAAICLPFPDEFLSGRRVFQQDGWAAVLGRVLGDIHVEDRALIAYRRHDRSLSHAERLQAAADSTSGRRADLKREQRRARLVADRVRDRDAPWDADRRDEILALDRFLTVRSERRGLLRRLDGIGRELRRGSYRRFARGTLTALYDLVDTFLAVT